MVSGMEGRVARRGAMDARRNGSVTNKRGGVNVIVDNIPAGMITLLTQWTGNVQHIALLAGDIITAVAAMTREGGIQGGSTEHPNVEGRLSSDKGGGSPVFPVSWRVGFGEHKGWRRPCRSSLSAECHRPGGKRRGVTST